MLELVIGGVGLVIAGSAFGLALVSGYRARRLQQALEQAVSRIDALEHQQALAQQSLSGLTAGAVGMDRRLRRVEATEKLLTERQETIENQQAAEQPYHHAIRLVQQGATARRLVEELSLSESEAELLVRLHGLRDSA